MRVSGTSAKAFAEKHRLKTAGRGYVGMCPACGYRDALSASDGEHGRLLLFCHSGCDFDRIACAVGWERSSGLGVTRQLSRSAEADDRTNRQRHIQDLIDTSLPASGGPVTHYLASRGINLRPPPDIRCLRRHWHKPSGGTFPVMLGIVRNLLGKVVGLHRTYLVPDGSGKAPVMPAKMTLGKIGGGAVRLHEPDVDLGAIGITEGIETALSVAQAINMPVWAALSAGGIEKLRLPAAAQDVVIFADRDSHGRGQQAAEQAADRFTGEGRRVRIILPPTVGIDFNDMIAEGSG